MLAEVKQGSTSVVESPNFIFGFHTASLVVGKTAVDNSIMPLRGTWPGLREYLCISILCRWCMSAQCGIANEGEAVAPIGTISLTSLTSQPFTFSST